MAFNIEEIAQKQNRLLANMSEQNRKAYEMFYSPVPADVTLPQYDENGQLVNVSIPNRAKIKAQMWDDVGGALGQFDRTFYIDAVNGDDLNDGSDTAPFATLKKAVDSIPIGGKGTIYLLSDISVGERLIANKKYIIINGYDSGTGGKRTITFKVFSNGLYNSLGGFYDAAGSNIVFYFCNLSFDEAGADPALTYDSFAQVVSYGSRSGAITTLSLSICDVTLPNNSAIVLMHSNGAGSMGRLSMYGTTINSTGANSFVARITQSSLIVDTYSSALAGAKTAFADLLLGIVRDTNGVPRNILSNLVL